MDRNVTFGIIRRSPGYIPYRTRSILAACDLMNGVVFSRSSASRVTALTCLLCLLCAVPCWAQQYTVLTLLATRREAPGNVVYDEVVQRVLSEKLVGTVDHYSEYLEIGRFEHPEYLPAVRAFVRQKYSGVRFDLILASTNAAVEFLQEYREEVFPGVPVVFSAGPGLALGPNS
ncbi:MAG TPA: hypothetical protein VFO36_09965, partial [Nitrospiraceae bacterium]|nr:hypothetical protein [Nitrospiraceae bacterium]